MTESGEQVLLEENRALAMDMLSFMDLSSDEEEHTRRETAKRIREYQRAMDKLHLSGKRGVKTQKSESNTKSQHEPSLFTGRDISTLPITEIESIWRPNNEDNIVKFEGRPPANCVPMGCSSNPSNSSYSREINRALFGDTDGHPEPGTKAYYEAAQNYAIYGKYFMDFPQNLSELWTPMVPQSQAHNLAVPVPMREPPGFERLGSGCTKTSSKMVNMANGADVENIRGNEVVEPEVGLENNAFGETEIDPNFHDENVRKPPDTVGNNQCFGLGAHALAYGASTSNANKRSQNHAGFGGIYGNGLNINTNKIGYLQVAQPFVYNVSPNQSYLTARPIATVANPTLLYTKPFGTNANQCASSGAAVDMCMLYAQMMQQRFRSPIPHTTHTNQQAAMAAAMAAQQAQQQFVVHQAQLHHAAQQQYAAHQQQQIAAAQHAAQQEKHKQHDKLKQLELLKQLEKLQQDTLESEQLEREALEQEVNDHVIEIEEPSKDEQQDDEESIDLPQAQLPENSLPKLKKSDSCESTNLNNSQAVVDEELVLPASSNESNNI